jgi:hypothetical protein
LGFCFGQDWESWLRIGSSSKANREDEQRRSDNPPADPGHSKELSSIHTLFLFSVARA